MSAPPQKVSSLYNIADLKNATDDFLPTYLTSLPKPYQFKQIHTLADIRLALGYTAVVIAGILFYADWKLGWDRTKAYTLPACIVYFALNGAFTYWIWAVEKGVVFEGVRQNGQKLTLTSSTQKYKPTYTLAVTTSSSPSSSSPSSTTTISAPFTTWFNTHGYIDKPALKSWLARNIDAVGLADPDSLSGSTKAAEKKYDAIVGDVVASSILMGGFTSSTTAAETPVKSGAAAGSSTGTESGKKSKAGRSRKG